MDIYKNILIEALSKEAVKVTFENLVDPDELAERACYNAILEIRRALDDEALDDFQCVEQIILLLEGIGAGGGSRHDF